MQYITGIQRKILKSIEGRGSPWCALELHLITPWHFWKKPEVSRTQLYSQYDITMLMW